MFPGKIRIKKRAVANPTSLRNFHKVSNEMPSAIST
jgi:hypothetical protein